MPVKQNCPKASMEKLEEDEDETESLMDNKRSRFSLRKRINSKRSNGTKDEGKDEKVKLQNMETILKTDITARIVFPLTYVIFTVAYIIYYFQD